MTESKELRYSISIVHMILLKTGANRVPSETTLLKYCQKMGLVLDLGTPDTQLKAQYGIRVRYLLPQSRLQDVIDHFGIPTTMSDVGRSAENIGMPFDWSALYGL